MIYQGATTCIKTKRPILKKKKKTSCNVLIAPKYLRINTTSGIMRWFIQAKLLIGANFVINCLDLKKQKEEEVDRLLERDANKEELIKKLEDMVNTLTRELQEVVEAKRQERAKKERIAAERKKRAEQELGF